MSKNQKRIFYFSLVLIMAYWLNDVIKVTQPPALIPDETSRLFKQILILKVSSFALICLLLFGQGDHFTNLGWRTKNWPKQLLIGCLSGIFTFALIRLLVSPLLSGVFPEANQGPRIMVHFQEPSNLWIWLLIGIFGGGFVEELQRTFILTRFEKWKGKEIIIWVVIIDVISFGAGHLYQGPGGAISAGITGLIFALIYLRKRSFIEAFSAHALYDVIGIILGHMLMQ
jgi:membrane protease YdiL (CAAX protease family)